MARTGAWISRGQGLVQAPARRPRPRRRRRGVEVDQDQRLVGGRGAGGRGSAPSQGESVVTLGVAAQRRGSERGPWRSSAGGRALQEDREGGATRRSGPARGRPPWRRGSPAPPGRWGKGGTPPPSRSGLGPRARSPPPPARAAGGAGLAALAHPLPPITTAAWGHRRAWSPCLPSSCGPCAVPWSTGSSATARYRSGGCCGRSS